MSSKARRPSGEPPYWAPGTQITWREGSGPLGTGPPAVDLTAPHFAMPMTVVRDDAEALVAWLPIGTPVLRAARADGRGKRDDPATLFTTTVVHERGIHGLFDQLRIAPTREPWSIWIMFGEGTGAFAGWYVNLEAPHIRDVTNLYTTDHVLDVVVDVDGRATLKDEDELGLAVAQGVFTNGQAAAIQQDAHDVMEIVEHGAPPFVDAWQHLTSRALQRDGFSCVEPALVGHSAPGQA